MKIADEHKFALVVVHFSFALSGDHQPFQKTSKKNRP